MTTRAELAELIPRQRLVRLREKRVSMREIARRYGIRKDTLRLYARSVLPHHLYYIRRYTPSATPRCRRCSFLGEARNPLLADGMCLWCHVEKAGWDLLTYHESGLATMVLDKISCSDGV